MRTATGAVSVRWTALDRALREAFDVEGPALVEIVADAELI